MFRTSERDRVGHPRCPDKPLIRLRVDYTGDFELFSIHRFDSLFLYTERPNVVYIYWKTSVHRDYMTTLIVVVVNARSLQQIKHTIIDLLFHCFPFCILTAYIYASNAYFLVIHNSVCIQHFCFWLQVCN